ncbi:unnamed protein product [Parnassius apollo]|uniref:(apollo) hypothetical protein n=1 Tax=Parnassius apollo TaxID=110799 RepID=A0A8S3Y2N4_PARAO|nr:unnamed protein product [Parnassius apollo]
MMEMLPVDVDNIVLKTFSEFPHAAKKRQDLKECFEFYESKFKEVLRHVPTRWLSLFKALDRVLSSWGPLKKYFLELGVNNCSPAIWAIIKDQKDNPTTETNPTYTELYLYFTHNFMASFQEVLLLLENNDTLAFSLHSIMTQFRDTIVKKIYDEHFGMKVRMAMNKKYLSDEETQEFKKTRPDCLSTSCCLFGKVVPVRKLGVQKLQLLGP